MATIDTTERVVFLADTDRRARHLRRGGVIAGLLAGFWLIGLGIGMLGLGKLPGIRLPVAGHATQRPPVAPSAVVVRRPTALSTRTPGAAKQRAATVQSARAAVSSGRSTPSRPRASVAEVTVTPKAKPKPIAVAAPVVQPTPQPTSRAVRRGLTRRGLTAAPGQTRKTTQPQPARTRPGQVRKAELTATPQPPPPGQQKPPKNEPLPKKT